MKILLTGATGFLGGHLANAFINAGHQVNAIGRESTSRVRVSALRDIGVNWVENQLASGAGLRDLFTSQGFDVVVHTAAIYGRKNESWAEMASSNLVFGLQLMQLAVENLVPLFVNTDSSLPRNFNAYTLSKAQLSDWAKFSYSESKLQFINVRLEHMFGPGDDDSKFTEYVVRACCSNQPELALTSGEAIRDFVYIDDVAAAYIALVSQASNIQERFPASSYLEVPVGSGMGHPVRHYVELVHRLSQSSTALKFGAIPYRKGEIMHSVADLAEMTRIGWTPDYGLEQGIRKMLGVDQ